MERFKPRAAPKSQVGGNKTSILFIDDDVKFLTLVKEVMENKNFNVELAFDDRDGLLKYQPGRFDVVFCDRKLPNAKEGDDVIRAIKRMNPKQKTVIFSTNASAIPDDEKKTIGADLYLNKPSNVREIWRIEELLSKAIDGLTREKI